MGFNTTVVVLNDALGDIEGDPKFGKNLANAIRQVGSLHKSVDDKRIDVHAGSHGNAASVIETHHASSNVAVIVGGNFGSVLGEVYADYSSELARHHEEAGQLLMLKALAEKFGYRLSKIPKVKEGDGT